MVKCRIPECENSISNRETELCHKHNLRLKRYGTTELTRSIVDKTKKCKAECCDRAVATNEGYCLMHYKRWKKYGTHDLPERVEKKCMFCEDKAIAKNMCSRHYYTDMKYGDALYVDNYRKSKNIQGYYKAQGGKYTVLHRVKAEEYKGEPLEDGEIVHHIDLDKGNNEEGNLHICQSRSEHSLLHRQLERLGGELVKQGVIFFNGTDYEIDYTKINTCGLLK